MVTLMLSVTLLFAGCPTNPQISCYVPETKTAYVQPGLPTWLRKSVIAHELTHAADYQVLTWEDRRWLAKRIPHRGGWFTLNSTYSNGAEKFAMQGDKCANPSPNDGRIPAVCNWLKQRGLIFKVRG